MHIFCKKFAKKLQKSCKNVAKKLQKSWKKNCKNFAKCGKHFFLLCKIFAKFLQISNFKSDFRPREESVNATLPEYTSFLRFDLWDVVQYHHNSLCYASIYIFLTGQSLLGQLLFLLFAFWMKNFPRRYIDKLLAEAKHNWDSAWNSIYVLAILIFHFVFIQTLFYIPERMT